MSANQTQDKSMDLLVACPLDMKAVLNLFSVFNVFFSVCIVVIYKKESFVVLGKYM